jgi:hypothetical protein
MVCDFHFQGDPILSSTLKKALFSKRYAFLIIDLKTKTIPNVLFFFSGSYFQRNSHQYKKMLSYSDKNSVPHQPGKGSKAKKKKVCFWSAGGSV